MSLDNISMETITREKMKMATATREQIEKEIGKERTEIVMRFRELIDNREYIEAKKFYDEYVRKNRQREEDLDKYAFIHLKALSCSNF